MLIFARAKQLTQQLALLIDRTIEENIEIHWDVADDVWDCFADAQLLGSALINLIVNARDALSNGGKIWLSADNAHDKQGNETLVFTVADNGTGMAPEVQDKIFEPFFTTKPVGKGGGLGLSMVHGFVTQSGGSIEVISKPGEGSKISVSLPRSRRQPETNNIPHAQDFKRLKIAKGEIILIVEDELAVRQTTVAMAEQLGFKTVQAENGVDAMKLLSENQRIRIVLSDVRLPGEMQGDQISGHLAKLERPIPCLLTTGNAPSDVHRVAHPKLLYKPFTIAELAQAIDRTMVPDLH